MTEQDIIDLGLKRVTVTPEESGYENLFYYYTLDFTSGLGLITKANDEIENDNWSVYIWDVEDEVEFTVMEDVRDFIYLITSNMKHAKSNKKAKKRSV